MFDPNIRKNQHYVPVFWLKRFAGTGGILYGLKKGEISPISAKKYMSEEYLYTTFDENYIPSNWLEEAAAKSESDAARAFRTLDDPGSTGTTEDQILLRWFIAFSACRHPDTMSSGHHRAKDMAYAFADVHSNTRETYCFALGKFGIDTEFGSALYDHFRKFDLKQLLNEASDIELMQPTDPDLPKQMAIDCETIERVFFSLSYHSVTILEAPDDLSYIIGDTPLPPELGYEFTVPISNRLALLWEPGSIEMFPSWDRRIARIGELESSNQTQSDNARDVVIGRSRAVLQKYA